MIMVQHQLGPDTRCCGIPPPAPPPSLSLSLSLPPPLSHLLSRGGNGRYLKNHVELLVHRGEAVRALENVSHVAACVDRDADEGRDSKRKKIVSEESQSSGRDTPSGLKVVQVKLRVGRDAAEGEDLRVETLNPETSTVSSSWVLTETLPSLRSSGFRFEG